MVCHASFPLDIKIVSCVGPGLFFLVACEEGVTAQNGTRTVARQHTPDASLPRLQMSGAAALVTGYSP